jgi:hypothetical protein
MDELEKLEKLMIKVKKAQEAVGRAKLAVRESTNDYEKDIKKRVLKSAKTKLKNAKIAYKDAKPKSVIRQKMGDVHELLKNTMRKIPVKKTLSWTGLAATTVITFIGGYVLYDRMGKNGESPTKDSM